MSRIVEVGRVLILILNLKYIRTGTEFPEFQGIFLMIENILKFFLFLPVKVSTSAYSCL